MKKALILLYRDLKNDPRPNRMLECLYPLYQVTVCGKGSGAIDRAEFISFPESTKPRLQRIVEFVVKLKIGAFEDVIWREEMRSLHEILDRHSFDLIVVHDLELLPLALRIRKNGKVLFDAREYYPRHYEDRFTWRFLFQAYNHYLCRTYLGLCDRMITVSSGISEEYEQQFGVKSEVIMSLPPLHRLTPKAVNQNQIRILYHGAANPSRRTDLMIKMMDHVDKRFTLDLMLMPNQPAYLRKLKRDAGRRHNVKIIDPVAYSDIITVSNDYDIGLFLVPPTTFNLKYTLPNKFFEYIQARMAVAIGPSIEMKRLVDQYDCGIIAADFQPESMAHALNRLPSQQIEYYKQRSHQAALELNMDMNIARIRSILENMSQGSGSAA